MLVSGNFGLVWLLILSFSLSAQVTQADHILAIFAYAFSSPYLVARPLIKALVEREHQVTVISGERHFEAIGGVDHIRIPMLDTLLKDILDKEYANEAIASKWSKATWISRFYYYTSHFIVADSKVQQMLHNSSVHYDMIIMNTPHSDALCGFSQHFNAPMVGLAAFGSAWIIDYLAGHSTRSVYEPMYPEGYTLNGRPSLLDKWNNWIYMTEEWLVERLVYLPPQGKLYKQYFDKSYSNFHNIRRNFSLILVNQHFSLARVRPNVPNLIEVAGMHICMEKDCKLQPMSEDLQNFMEEAEHGIIYFSMGVEILMKWLPKDMKQTLLEVFSNLKQRVIWKYDKWETLKNKSDNIYVRSFLPQQQILNHPKVKLFITHAGLLSLIETVYYGVPILSLPLYYDQFANAERMRLARVGQTLDLNSINVKRLNQSIHELLQNPSYARNAKKMSTWFRDQPMSALDTAIWWIEYILRHKGALHMRLAEEEISFMQYYCLDLLPILFGRIGLTAIIIFVLLYKLTNIIIARSHFTLNIAHIII